MIEFAKAMNTLQSELGGVKKGKNNPFFSSKYADLSIVWDTIREPLTKAGFSIMQLPCEAPAGHVGLWTIIQHESGQSIESKFFMPLKDPTNPQAVGSALTYAKRYVLLGAVGVAPEDDDDGNAAASNSQTTKPSAEAIAQIAAVEAEFLAAKDLEGKKAAYLKMKGLAGIDRTRVTKYLSGMSGTIKILMAKEKSDDGKDS